jgi:cyclase
MDCSEPTGTRPWSGSGRSRRTEILSLRSFHRFLAVVFAISSLSPPAALAGPVAENFKVQRLTDGVYAVIRQDPPGMMCDGNSGFIVGNDGVVVIDAPEASREVLAAIKKVTKKPVTAVINTHWHDDHIIGNQVYRNAFPKARFIAHEATREYLAGPGIEARQRMVDYAPKGVDQLQRFLASGVGPDRSPLDAEERASMESDVQLVEHYLEVVPKAVIVLPTEVVRDSMTLRQKSREIRILYLGPGHTSGDLVVWLPRERILFSGDLVVWPIPLVGGDQSHVGSWSATLNAMRDLHPQTIVPGHGPVEADDSYAALLSRLFASVKEQVETPALEGKSLAEIRKFVDLSEFRNKLVGNSKVRSTLFGMYVEGPAVESAFRDATSNKADLLH